MAFISNAENFTLGGGVYTNVHGNIIHNHFYGPKRDREEIEGPTHEPRRLEGFYRPDSGREEIEDVSPLLIERAHKRRHKRRRSEGAVEWEPEAVEMASIGLEIIDHEDLGLIHQIGRGPGYLLHAGRNKKKNRAVTVKVFNNAPTTRQQLELEVTLLKGLMHPNIPRLEGISSSTSMPQFIAYEEFRWKQAKGPLATALQSRVRSIELGFKMVADISAGLSYLSMQRLRMATMRVQNFDVFLHVDDRFLILVNPTSDETDVPTSQAPQEDSSWALFNGICHKLLVGANRILHNEGIDRSPALLPPTPTFTSPYLFESPASSIGAASSQDGPEDAPSTVDPRREYVWRAMDRGDQSLATITDEMSANLSTVLGRLHRLTQTNTQSPHRCQGYLREEITLAPTVVDSALVAHDTPSPLEICSVCHEVVGFQETFRCVCAASDPGLHHTIKCKVCKVWSHSQCVGNVEPDFTCRFCDGPETLTSMLRPPKLAPSAWQLYFTDWIQRQQASSSRKLNVAQAAREAGQEYASLSEEEREPYKRRSQAAKDIRERELHAYMRTLTPDYIKRENAFRAAHRKAGKSRMSNIKDPNAPKKPLSAYFMFLQRIRASRELMREVFGEETETTRQSVLAAVRWRAMTDEERRPFLEQAAQEKMDYEAARRLYEDGAMPYRTSINFSTLPRSPVFSAATR